MEYLMKLLQFFTLRELKFDNGNIRRLWSSMSEDDRETFWYDLDELDWTSYARNYYYGIRKHILREDLSNREEALARKQKYDN